MEVVKTSLIFYHDNASVQGGFSINKSILVEIQYEENLIAQRKGYDLIIHYNSIQAYTKARLGCPKKIKWRRQMNMRKQLHLKEN